MTMMQMNVRPASGQANELLFDWKLDVERLEREARSAVERRQSDPWALVEAECSLDLIDAEIAALRLKGRESAAAHSLAHLSGWRTRIERAVRMLNSVPADERR
ncbi:hypothetical protein [Devosia sp. CN2-171]|uniref:hypothetical protein n=1 Tax=Devosia sp. CN2-171 TaxID=3400909 RepID=UPI003BF7DF5F